MSRLFHQDGKPYIFIHIPKTAGMSMYHALGINNGQHRSITDYRDHQLYSEAYKFAFVRNPFDRVVSAFFYFNSADLDIHDQLIREKYIARFNGDFKDFISNGLDMCSREVVHFLPQIDFITDMQGKIALDFIGLFESIDDETRRLQKESGITFTQPFERTNISKHRDYKSYFTDQSMIDKIAEVYQDDFTQFDYSLM